MTEHSCFALPLQRTNRDDGSTFLLCLICGREFEDSGFNLVIETIEADGSAS